MGTIFYEIIRTKVSQHYDDTSTRKEIYKDRIPNKDKEILRLLYKVVYCSVLQSSKKINSNWRRNREGLLGQL